MKIFTVLGLIFSFFFGSLRYGFTPTIIFDAAELTAPVSSRASGFLYGLAEENVPDALTARSLDISSVSQKVIDGLQHPIGDVDHVAENLEKCDYIVVYLQDAYDTWYYDNEHIYDLRSEGKYDWKTYLQEDYFPKVREKVNALKDKPYADRLVYCLYNECDNGVWFGTWQKNDRYAAFDENGRQAFFEAWKLTFELVRSLDPDAKIGGPGYCDYDPAKQAWFLNYCEENDCMPDVMIWHELGELSSEQLDLHVKNYRNLEELLQTNPLLPIVITEYGTMQECGDPAAMFRYIRQIEETGVWGDIAYWRLADNLCDASADGVSPNACWWLYRWYADMEGSLLAKEVQDLFHADFGKAVKEARQLRHKHYNGFAALNEEQNEITVLAGGASYQGKIKLKHLNKTGVGKNVRVTVEAVTFEGLGGKVFSPVCLQDYEAKTILGGLSIDLGEMNEEAVYHITVTPADGSPLRETGALPERFEFERGTLLGAAYAYDSAYATTGEVSGMVGGMERPGDGVRLLFTVPETGNYDLNVIYGKANDGTSPSDRKSAKVNVKIDGEAQTLTLPNTIRSEYTGLITLTAKLERGDHSIEFTHNTGTFVLDSLLVSPVCKAKEIMLLREHEACTNDGTGYLAVAPENGWYQINAAADPVTVNGSECKEKLVYLRQGLNLIELGGKNAACTVTKTKDTDHMLELTAADLSPADGAKIVNGALTGITSENGSASFTVNAPAAGDYCFTFTYANNAEGGYHAYNVDLIERYFTVSAAGQKKNVWCRNTYSEENTATVTFNLRLNAGENTVTLTNDGNIRFDGRENGTPVLFGVTVDPASK